MATKSLAIAPPRTPDISLLDMPNEILRQILLAIDEKFSRTLWSVCLTCKQLRAIVEEYCEPEYNVRGRIIEDPFALMERILAQPCLRYIIRAARTEYNYDTEHTEAEVDTLITSLGLDSLKDAIWNECEHGVVRDDEGITWLAALLSRLEIVEVSSTTPNSKGDWPRLVTLLNDAETCNQLSSHGFRYLYSLILRYPTCFITIPQHPKCFDEVYAGMLKLPKLRTLVLDNIMFEEERWPYVFERLSSVEELHIQEYQEPFMFPELPNE